MSFIPQIRKNEILRNILTLMGGTSLAQIIPIGLQPLLRRLYEPEVFGIYALYLTYIGIVVVISSLKWEMAIVIQKDDRKAINVAGLSLITIFIINTTLLIIGIVFFDPLTRLLKFPEGSGWWMLLVPVSASLLSSYQVMNYWLVRNKSFFAVSANKIVRRTIEGGVHSGFGINAFGPGMMFGDILGNMANLIAGVYQSIRKGLSFGEMRLSQMKIVAKEQIDFPKYQALPALLTTISVSLPVIIVTKFFGIAETSYFDLTRMVLLVPSTLIATAVSQVLFQNISERINIGKPILTLLLKTSSVLLLIAALVVVIMYLAGPYLFGLVFEQSYRISGEYARILSVAFMFQFIAAPISITLIALKKLKVQGLWQAGYFLTMIILLFSNYKDVNHFFWIFTLVNIIAYSIYWLITVYQARVHDNSL